MAIRIRVYPQPHSVGARRNRAIRRQRQQLALQRQQFAWQQRLMRQQQQLLQPPGLGFGNAYGNPYRVGFGMPPGASWNVPAASGWGFASPVHYPPAIGSIGSAWSGGYATGYSPLQVGAAPMAPFGVAQQAGFGSGWFGSGFFA